MSRYTAAGGGAGSDTTAIHDDTASEISAVTGATVAAGDFILFEDADDSNAKKQDTVQGILDLAGGGLTEFVESRETGTENISILTPAVAADNISLNLEGGGALMVTNSDGTSTGGNARGAGAVDLQVSRLISSEVASGAAAIITNGRDNTSSGADAISGGWDNTASGGQSIALGGKSNVAAGTQNVVIGGFDGVTANVTYATIIGGNDNIVNNTYGAIFAARRGDVAANYGTIIGGDIASVTGAYAVTLGGIQALADHPCSVVFSGNSTFVGDSGRGKSQGQLVHIDQRTTNNTKTPMDSNGTELTCPTDGLFTLTGTVSVWNETDGTATDWAVNVLAKNVAGTVTLLRGGGTPITIQTTDDAGVPVLDIVVSSALIRFDVTGITAKNMRWTGVLLAGRAQT